MSNRIAATRIAFAAALLWVPARPALAQNDVQITPFVQAGEPLPDEIGEVFDFLSLKGAPPTTSSSGDNIVLQTGLAGDAERRLFLFEAGRNPSAIRLTVPQFRMPGPFVIATPDPAPDFVIPDPATGGPVDLDAFDVTADRNAVTRSYPVNDLGDVVFQAGYIVDTGGGPPPDFGANGTVDPGFQVDASSNGILLRRFDGNPPTQVAAQQGCWQEPRVRVCQGGAQDGMSCVDATECPPTIGTCDAPTCLAGANAGNPCSTDPQCPGSFCRGRCTNTGSTCNPTLPDQCMSASGSCIPAVVCFSDFSVVDLIGNETSPVLTEPGDVAFRAATSGSQGNCVGTTCLAGVNAGMACTSGADCPGSLCTGFCDNSGSGCDASDPTPFDRCTEPPPGVWLGPFNGPLMKLAGVGDDSGTAPGSFFREFSPPIMRSNPATVVFRALDLRGNQSGSGLWKFIGKMNPGGPIVEPAIASGSAAPSPVGGTTFSSFSQPGGITDGRITAFQAELAGAPILCNGLPPGSNHGIYELNLADGPFVPELILQTGQTISANGIDLCFDSFQEALINAPGDLLIFGRARLLNLPNFSPLSRVGVLLQESAGSFRIAAAESLTVDNMVPAVGGLGNRTEEMIQSIDHFALNARGDIAMEGVVALLAGTVRALFLRPNGGSLLEIVREGDQIPGFTGQVNAFKTALGVPRGSSLISHTGNADGLPSALSDRLPTSLANGGPRDGQAALVFAATFTACQGGPKDGQPCHPLFVGFCGGLPASCEEEGGAVFRATASAGDRDGDGVLDDVDNCPDVPNPSQTDSDADGVGDACDVCPGFPDDGFDGDGDGIPDECDQCPGFDDTADADADGVPDGCDVCPGFDDGMDADGDGVPNGCDNCPNNPNANQADADGDGVGNACDLCPGFNDRVDADGDGIPDGCDVCPGGDDNLDADGDGVPNACDKCPGFPDAPDADGDMVPDACDICPGFDDALDVDVDGVPDGCDNCPLTPNPGQGDFDRDTVGDACDNCPGRVNPDQLDADADGFGDVCDNCVEIFNPNQENQDQADDPPGDGIGDLCDDCPRVTNPDQADADGDGIGDACECGDASGDGVVNTTDARLIQRCAVGAIPCPALCDVTGEGTCNTTDARLIQRLAVGQLGKDGLRCAERP